jgi:hypothetical protein
MQDEITSRKAGYADDKANIESGHAKAVRERYEFKFSFVCICIPIDY